MRGIAVLRNLFASTEWKALSARFQWSQICRSLSPRSSSATGFPLGRYPLLHHIHYITYSRAAGQQVLRPPQSSDLLAPNPPYIRWVLEVLVLWCWKGCMPQLTIAYRSKQCYMAPRPHPAHAHALSSIIPWAIGVWLLGLRKSP